MTQKLDGLSKKKDLLSKNKKQKKILAFRLGLGRYTLKRVTLNPRPKTSPLKELIQTGNKQSNQFLNWNHYPSWLSLGRRVLKFKKSRFIYSQSKSNIWLKNRLKTEWQNFIHFRLFLFIQSKAVSKGKY